MSETQTREKQIKPTFLSLFLNPQRYSYLTTTAERWKAFYTLLFYGVHLYQREYDNDDDNDWKDLLLHDFFWEYCDHHEPIVKSLAWDLWNVLAENQIKNLNKAVPLYYLTTEELETDVHLTDKMKQRNDKLLMKHILYKFSENDPIPDRITSYQDDLKNVPPQKNFMFCRNQFQQRFLAQIHESLDCALKVQVIPVITLIQSYVYDLDDLENELQEQEQIILKRKLSDSQEKQALLLQLPLKKRIRVF